MTRKRWIIGIPVLLLLPIAFVGGVFMRGGTAAGTQGIYGDIALFNEILNLVSEHYVEPVGSDSLIEGAIDGMLRQLDPHSNYIDPKRFDQMEERNRGSYQGIGVSFAIREGKLTVISPIEGGPSDRLGIQAGDVITHINGESAFGIKENEVFEKLRGPKGTSVNVTVERRGFDHPLEFEIIRDEIPIESVPYIFMISPGTGYIRMRNFSARTSEELYTALQKLEAQGMQRLILDLRGNSGGYLNAAVEVCDLFLSGSKKIVYTQGRIQGSSEEYYSSDQDTDFNLPLIVLIDAGSASASEIVAGAMQDWDRGLVVGRTSFGKGLVQRQYRLNNGGALLLTVARYYTPSGRLIQRPYQPNERDEYFQEVMTRNAEPAKADSSAPVFHTMLRGRPVTGGGGITPDVVLDETYRSSQLNADLVYERKYLDFADDYVPDHRGDFPTDFQSFLADTTLDPKILREFRTMLDADTFAYSPDSIVTYQSEIERNLRSEFARYLWGENERAQVLVAADPSVRRALGLLPQAEAMLAESRRIEAERAAAN